MVDHLSGVGSTGGAPEAPKPNSFPPEAKDTSQSTGNAFMDVLVPMKNNKAFMDAGVKVRKASKDGQKSSESQAYKTANPAIETISTVYQTFGVK